MRIRVVSTAIGATAVVISIVAACGGYGGSSGMGGGVYGGSAAPTVAFSTPAAAMNVNLGQAVKLAWTSTNATSCTASASSMTGGTFSGSQAVSGEMNVVPTATGSVTYTLSCSGAGGMTNASSASVTVNPAIITQLASVTPTTIGSTIDPVTHEGNPYGLAIAPVTAGLITAGDLIVCNFNDNGNPPVQGHGTTVVGLHPTSGATPYHIAGDAKLQGCNAVTVLPDDSISAAAFTANMNPLVTAAGAINTPFAADSFNGPWGEAFAAANGANPAAIYVSNFDGSIDRIALNGDAQTSFTKIASGFCGSGSPGAIYAPAGLTYDAAIDTLYIVDTSSNSVVALANVSAIGAGGVVVNGGCNTVASPPTPAASFSGTSAASA
ncbi:MAG: hypothetical protein JO299_01100, partial [Gammaproteobacteria bacterium]|nr:hypothetical protein [Gammaproteobacteria bacterium]